MKKLLKLISMALCTVFAFSLFACDMPNLGSSSDDGEFDIADVTEADWADMMKDEQFENLTFKMDATLYEDGKENNEVYIYKIVGEVCAEVTEDGDDIYDADEGVAEQLRTMFIKTVLEMLETKDNYKVEDGNFVNATDSIVYDVEITDETATITATNVKVSISEDKKIATIECHMEQLITSSSNPYTIVLDVRFDFYDYGTTTIEGINN